MEEIITALELKKELDSLRPIDKEQEAKIMQKFRLDWNYHSNKLEGNSLTYGETKALIMYGLTAHGKSFQDHSEMRGHNDAVNWVVEIVKGERPLTENLIRELHQVLLVESYEVDAITPDGKPTKKRINVGCYKTSPNHVETKTGEIFYFATPEETPAEMATLMEWYNQKIEESDFNPILLAAEFHYKFIRIHPFDDGNGRTARILMNFILMKFGYPPVIIKTEDKINYFAALQLADTGNIEAFVTYIAKNLIRSLEIIIAGARGEEIEEPDDIDKELALLEKKLAGFGKEIEKQKSVENINIIYTETVYPLIQQLKQKFNVFEKYYLYSNIYLQIDGEQYNWPDYPKLLDKIVREMRIGLILRELKKQGFENYSFDWGFYFDFDTLKYSVRADSRDIIYSKNYDNLNNRELKSLIDKAILEYKNRLETMFG